MSGLNGHRPLPLLTSRSVFPTLGLDSSVFQAFLFLTSLHYTPILRGTSNGFLDSLYSLFLPCHKPSARLSTSPASGPHCLSTPIRTTLQVNFPTFNVFYFHCSGTVFPQYPFKCYSLAPKSSVASLATKLILFQQTRDVSYKLFHGLYCLFVILSFL